MDRNVDFLGGHFEAFEVTFPKLASAAAGDGTSSGGPLPSALTLELFCANPRTHYEMCLRENTVSASVSAARLEGSALESRSSHEEDVIDHTGLRVYEGAQVMAAFIAACARDTFASTNQDASVTDIESVQSPKAHHDALHHVFGSLPSGTNNSASSCEESVPWVVELGCGCGLTGLTAAVFFPEMNIVLTDASEACLKLVEKSVERNRASGVIPQQSNSRHIAYEPLMWTDEGAEELLRKIGTISSNALTRKPSSSVRLILGSDIMYYRVDVNQLLSTCRTLLVGHAGDGNTAGDDDDPAKRWGVVIFAHYMRLPNGKKLLREAAHRLGFRIARVPLSSFMDTKEAVWRGWSGMEVAILVFPKDGSVACGVEQEDVTVVRRVLRDCFHFPASLPNACETYTSDAEDAEIMRQLQQKQHRTTDCLDGQGEAGISFDLPFVDMDE